ncbi:MAG TPA: hypothetical protein DDY38_08410 [Firmicutes bacterium]|nr:hypothetical protein [Bacillota bacterium]
MTEKSRLVNILDKVLPKDIPGEIIVLTQHQRVSRMLQNNLVQGSECEKMLVRVRVEEGGRVGEEATNVFSLSSLRQTVARARKLAETGRPGPLILSGYKGYREMSQAPAATSTQSPQAQAAMLAPLADLAGKANLLVDACLSAEIGELAIVNTLGLAAHTKAAFSEAKISVASTTGPGRGCGYACDRNAEKLDVIAPFFRAAAKCQASERPLPLPAGEYTVILEPAAAADLIRVAAKIFFDGRAFLERRTPFAQLGARLFGDQLSIWDDSLHPQGLQMPFDFEGVPKQRLNLVNRGIIQAVCLDNETAAQLKTVSTGHAALPDSGSGPIPRHLAVEAGNAMIDDMIASTKRGILVSRFHDISVLDSCAAVITGTTACGTLLVEEGKLTAALPDLRFVQNLSRALSNIEMTGDETKLFGGLWEGLLVPALKLNRFSFLTGNTGQV